MAGGSRPPRPGGRLPSPIRSAPAETAATAAEIARRTRTSSTAGRSVPKPTIVVPSTGAVSTQPSPASGTSVRALGMTSIVTNASLVRRLAFPRAIVPASATITAAITFAVNSVVVAGFIAWEGITPQLDWLLIPLLVIELYVFILGVAFILSTLFVFFRDIGQVWELGLQLLFYASPIIYPIGFLPPWARDLAFINPVT